ncbi:MAG: hypothetical protein L6R37_006369 [Teloschistes peruensis]|nr:MAG: hypothetical protein L6R37_006369 [Teloschistes peruensis]
MTEVFDSVMVSSPLAPPSTEAHRPIAPPKATGPSPIISYGNDRFGRAQKNNGASLALQHHQATDTFRIITGEEGRISYFGREDPGLKLMGAVTPLLEDCHALVRLIFTTAEGKTDFRNVKLPSAAHAKELVEHLVQMRSIPAVQRPQSDLVLKQGLGPILQDLAKQWEKAVPGDGASSNKKTEEV